MTRGVFFLRMRKNLECSCDLTWSNLTRPDLTWPGRTWPDLTWRDVTSPHLIWSNPWSLFDEYVKPTICKIFVQIYKQLDWKSGSRKGHGTAFRGVIFAASECLIPSLEVVRLCSCRGLPFDLWTHRRPRHLRTYCFPCTLLATNLLIVLGSEAPSQPFPES